MQVLALIELGPTKLFIASLDGSYTSAKVNYETEYEDGSQNLPGTIIQLL
jgi:hypothetical protein